MPGVFYAGRFQALCRVIEGGNIQTNSDRFFDGARAAAGAFIFISALSVQFRFRARRASSLRFNSYEVSATAADPEGRLLPQRHRGNNLASSKTLASTLLWGLCMHKLTRTHQGNSFVEQRHKLARQEPA